MAFTPKTWEDELHLLEVLEGKKAATSTTPVNAAALKDLEERLSGYADGAIAATAEREVPMAVLRPDTVGIMQVPSGIDLGTFHLGERLDEETFVYAICNLGRGRLLAGTQPTGAVFASDDGGITWSLVKFNVAGAATIHDIAHIGKGIVLAATDNEGRVARSTDYGATWDGGTKLVGAEKVNCFADLGAGVVLAGSRTAAEGGKVFRSIDHGATWSEGVKLAGTNQGVNWIGLLGKETVVLGGFDDLAVNWFRSTDNGKTFTRIESAVLNASNGEYGHTGVFLGEGTAVIGTYGGAFASHLYRTTDYGATWANVYSAEAIQGFFALENLGGGILLAGSGINAKSTCRVYISRDNGLTWSVYQTEFGETATHVLALKHLGDGIVLAGMGTEGTVWRIGVSSAMPASDASQVVIVGHNLSGKELKAGCPVIVGGTASQLAGAGADAPIFVSGGGALAATIGVLLENTPATANGRVCVMGVASVTAVEGKYAPGEIVAISGFGTSVEVNAAVAAHASLGKVLVGGEKVSTISVLVLPS